MLGDHDKEEIVPGLLDQSRDSLNSDNSAIDRIKRDCERKEEFLKSRTYPAYLSSPPKDIDQNPRGIANLASTMPPPQEKPPDPEPPAPPAKNFFMDIYAQEMSKMQTTAKTSAVPKKKHFDASQFNAYGLPLGEYIRSVALLSLLIPTIH